MKTYTILATIAIVLMLTACSADEEQTNVTTPPNKVQQFDTFDAALKDGDSTTEGYPSKPIKRD